MPDLRPTFTNAGLAAALSADEQGVAARITHLALGDAAYTVPVDGTGATAMVALQNERERVEITGSVKLSDTLLDVQAIADSAAAYWVREIGLYLSDGTLFAIWSSAVQPLGYKTADAPMIVSFELSLTALPANAVTVAGSGAPLELYNARELSVIATTISRLHLSLAFANDNIRQLLQP